jgi:hypothetical protein
VDRKSGSTLARYRKRIIAALYPDKGQYLRDYGAANREAARQAIWQYRQESADLIGALDLLLTFVEAGTRFTRDYGDIDADFYDDLARGVEDAAALLRSADGIPHYPRFQGRLRELAQLARPIAWEYSDFVAEKVQDLDLDLGEEGR